MSESSPERKLSAAEKARIEILAIGQIIAQEGAADSESGELKRVEDELHAGKIDPDQAINAVHNIRERRQSYH